MSLADALTTGSLSRPANKTRGKEHEVLSVEYTRGPVMTPALLRLFMATVRYVLSSFAILFIVFSTPALAKLDVDQANQELISANKAVNEGHVKEGIEALTKLLRTIDPAQEKELYWRTSTLLIELLSLTENHSLATQVISELFATKIPQSDLAHFQLAQYYIARNLAWTGHADEGDKILRVLTGAEARLVLSPAQRAGALLLSKIEGDRLNIPQSAIWMRRAVVGTLVDEAAGSEEIVDVLTNYAIYLSSNRRLLEATALFGKLEPIYTKYFNWHGPKYLRFAYYYLFNLTSLGNFQVADILLKRLNDIATGIDIVPNSVREELFFQNLYQSARSKPADGKEPVGDRLKKIVSDFPDFLKQPKNRIQFSYYALSAGDLDLADQFNSSIEASAPTDVQFAAYEVILRSFIAARRSQFSESVELVRNGLDLIRKFHQLAENESSRHLPALTIEERLVLGLILALDAGHISTFEQADTLFQLQQYLNRDKGTLGLSARAVRLDVKSDLRREDLRSRDRLLELRDRIMEEATDALLARVEPIRNYSPGRKNDYSRLTRLDDVEDKIQRIDEGQKLDASNNVIWSNDSPIDLRSIQKLLKPNEALVLHGLTGVGLATTCVDAENWTFHVQAVDKARLSELDSDYKALLNAVHATYAPSPLLDSEFPGQSSYHLYENLFGGIEACLKNKTQVFLATDPDFFSLPWNALLTSPPSEAQKFSNRNAAWLPKSYSLSLLPSVRSLHQLRTNLTSSGARKNFLGIGAPDLKGPPDKNKEIALAPLFVSRGVANRTAITELDALPETADELRDAAKTLGATESDLLLGSRATERELRNQPLNDFRVISFATHALVAGEIDGITEPALVLTPGTGDYSQKNDGLLTATEIASLTLDANLVILSACNTAASDGRASGRGLSGLADAFFFAGARSLAVTQWEVGSDEAKKIGSGLISRSVDPNGQGVADGLRRTMVDYISAAPQDYLAHPRFWAAFVIAGDGAARPLESIKTSESERHDYISIEQERVTPKAQELEFLSLTRIGDSIFTLGMQRPPAGEQRAGSYLARVRAATNIEVMDRFPELAPSAVVSFGSELGVLGFIATGQASSSAEFRLLDKSGRERWRYAENGRHWNLPISAVKSPAGYVFLSTDYENSTTPSTLIVTQVSETGRALLQRRYDVPIHVGGHAPKNVIVGSDGTLTISLPGRMIDEPSRQLTYWTNPKTGSKTVCINSPDATVLLSIDLNTLDLRAQKTLENNQVKTMRQKDGNLYAAIDFKTHCRLDTNIKLVEILPSFELRTIFETNHVNSIQVTDLEVTPEHFILIGNSHTFLPTSSTRESLGAEQLADVWNDSFWDHNEEQLSPFVLVVSAKGAYVSDRIISGVSHRTVSGLVALNSDSFVAIGDTFNSRGWVMSFSLHKQRVGFGHIIGSWLRNTWVTLGLGSITGNN
jgi:CHAT domain-containing protein